MNWITIAIGGLAVGLGIYSTYVRLKTPEKFAKLAAMRQQFGHRAGTVIHTVAYSTIPVITGIIFIVLGIQGGGLF